MTEISFLLSENKKIQITATKNHLNKWEIERELWKLKLRTTSK